MPRRMLITAGPTHEPIDAVRFIGNRSSGRLGVALANEAVGRGWDVTLLLGPTPLEPGPGVRCKRYRSTSDLEELLAGEFSTCDVLVMAAAVADYRPVGGPGVGKIKRAATGLTLQLEATPDLLAGCGARRRPEQLLIGFALEPEERLLASAREKISRKGIDAIVANPLRTMDASDIEAILIKADGTAYSTVGAISKELFAVWLLERIEELQSGR